MEGYQDGFKAGERFDEQAQVPTPQKQGNELEKLESIHHEWMAGWEKGWSESQEAGHKTQMRCGHEQYMQGWKQGWVESDLFQLESTIAEIEYADQKEKEHKKFLEGWSWGWDEGIAFGFTPVTPTKVQSGSGPAQTANALKEPFRGATGSADTLPATVTATMAPMEMGDDLAVSDMIDEKVPGHR